MKKYRVGYTTGVFDMFHIGHLNIIQKSKELCDFLIVGVTTDELVAYKNTKTIIPFEDRCRIVENIKGVDKVVAQVNMDKIAAWEKLDFDVCFVGSDWKGTKKWKKIEIDFKEVGVDVVYFEYTKSISSTKLREILEKGEKNV